YGSMDKKFVYQNWEGDWMLRGEGVDWERNPLLIPKDVDWIIEGMAQLFRARYRGTERARSEFPNTKAKVYYGVEFNKLWFQKSGNYITMAENGTPSVLGDVIPSVRIDLSSWSAYDGAWTNTNNPIGHALWKGLEIARYYTTQSGELDSNCPVQIGEFAINENPKYNSAATETNIRSRYGRFIGVAMGLGIPNFYLWNFYCSGNQDKPVGFTWEKGVRYDNTFLFQWLDGKWLLKPDGNWGWAAKFLMEQWNNALTYNSSIDSVSHSYIYPNPTTGPIAIADLDKEVVISILDSDGRKLIEFNHSSSQEIDISPLNSGTYFVLIQDLTKPIQIHKIIKK
ncbi:MAG TPA: T9SS type A sorting domain-containing protein, partial [Saprospiraceae bacterium]|nr:T9SS type A sorting domain-containing protein [Saprospiraceae bacterium]